MYKIEHILAKQENTTLMEYLDISKLGNIKSRSIINLRNIQIASRINVEKTQMQAQT